MIDTSVHTCGVCDLSPCVCVRVSAVVIYWVCKCQCDMRVVFFFWRRIENDGHILMLNRKRKAKAKSKHKHSHICKRANRAMEAEGCKVSPLCTHTAAHLIKSGLAKIKIMTWPRVLRPNSNSRSSGALLSLSLSLSGESWNTAYIHWCCCEFQVIRQNEWRSHRDHRSTVATRRLN